MADCTAECHTFCGGQVPSRRYLELALAFSGVTANVCSDDASPALSRLSAVIGIPKSVALRARPTAPELVAVRIERGGTSMACTPGADYDLVDSPDGMLVAFKGNCVLMPDDVYDVRYVTNK
jgi:hypothetical protein